MHGFSDSGSALTRLPCPAMWPLRAADAVCGC